MWHQRFRNCPLIILNHIWIKLTSHCASPICDAAWDKTKPNNNIEYDDNVHSSKNNCQKRSEDTRCVCLLTFKNAHTLSHDCSEQWITAANCCSLLANVSNRKMDPAGVVIVMSLLKATAGKIQRSCKCVCVWGGGFEWEERTEEREEMKRREAQTKKKGQNFKKPPHKNPRTSMSVKRTGGVMVHWIYSNPSVNTALPVLQGGCCVGPAGVRCKEGEGLPVTFAVEGGRTLHISESRLVLPSQ